MQNFYLTAIHNPFRGAFLLSIVHMLNTLNFFRENFNPLFAENKKVNVHPFLFLKYKKVFMIPVLLDVSHV